MEKSTVANATPSSSTTPTSRPLYDPEKEKVLLVQDNTGCGVLDAKKALIAHNWDAFAAVRHVRATHGIAARTPGTGPCPDVEDESDVQSPSDLPEPKAPSKPRVVQWAFEIGFRPPRNPLMYRWYLTLDYWRAMLGLPYKGYLGQYCRRTQDPTEEKQYHAMAEEIAEETDNRILTDLLVSHTNRGGDPEMAVLSYLSESMKDQIEQEMFAKSGQYPQMDPADPTAILREDTEPATDSDAPEEWHVIPPEETDLAEYFTKAAPRLYLVRHPVFRIMLRSTNGQEKERICEVQPHPIGLAPMTATEVYEAYGEGHWMFLLPCDKTGEVVHEPLVRLENMLPYNLYVRYARVADVED